MSRVIPQGGPLGKEPTENSAPRFDTAPVPVLCGTDRVLSDSRYSISDRLRLLHKSGNFSSKVTEGTFIIFATRS